MKVPSKGCVQIGPSSWVVGGNPMASKFEVCMAKVKMFLCSALKETP